MEIKCKLIVKEDTATFGASDFRKREFVVEYAENPQYPEFIKFQLVQDKCDLLDQYEIGQRINIAFNLRGRKWTNPKGEEVYFNSLEAWRLSTAEEAPNEAGAPRVQDPEWLNKEDDKEADDLPFALTLLLASSFVLQYLPI